MTLVGLRDALRGPEGPSWAHVFTEDEVTDALRKAKDDMRLTAFIQVPSHLLVGVVSRAAVHLNRLDPERMAGAMQKDQFDGPRSAA